MADLASLATLRYLGGDLARVEEVLRAAVVTEDALLTEIASHLIHAGGKRLRPALALTAAYAGLGEAEAPEAVVRGAVSVELVHLGSLYHDDVMDEAASRRGVDSVNARWGNLRAILAGDFLLARASELAASLGTEVSALLAATIGRLCEGQVRELAHAYDVGRTENDYFAAIAGKTASLMATSCRVGALAAGLPRTAVDALTAYGQKIGVVFQIVDDILDVVATDEQLGKPAGNDLVEGVYTLPVIRALAAAEGTALRDALGRPIDRTESMRVRDLVRSNGAVASAADVARAWAVEAADALAPLGGGSVVEALATLGDALIDRIPGVPA